MLVDVGETKKSLSVYRVYFFDIPRKTSLCCRKKNNLKTTLSDVFVVKVMHTGLKKIIKRELA